MNSLGRNCNRKQNNNKNYHMTRLSNLFMNAIQFFKAKFHLFSLFLQKRIRSSSLTSGWSSSSNSRAPAKRWTICPTFSRAICIFSFYRWMLTVSTVCWVTPRVYPVYCFLNRPFLTVRCGNLSDTSCIQFAICSAANHLSAFDLHLFSVAIAVIYVDCTLWRAV